MKNPLDDAETFKLDKNGFIKELGKKANDYSEIEGQYIGLFKIKSEFMPLIKDFLIAVVLHRLVKLKKLLKRHLTFFY